MKIFGIAGYSGSGKTTLIEKLIPVFTARGMRVSLIKHAHHTFDVDQPGKDSWRHRHAGCAEVLITSSRRWALMHELRGTAEPTLPELVAHLSACDLLLIEGFKHEAIPKLEEILRASDGIMVARGDLAVEVGNAAVPALQKRMIKLAREHDKVVITATQMMESMITNPVPTRAEVSDVANAVLDGTDAVMLSAETAAGKYPLETVVEMAKICHAAEAHDVVKLDADFSGKIFSRIDQSIAMGALFTAHHLGAKAIVAMTDSGSTPLWMSRHLIQIPIYAFTPRVATQRKMALYRNVRPLLKDTSGDRDTALQQAENDLKLRGLIQSGDIYAITCGEPMGAPGGTNMLKICQVV